MVVFPRIYEEANGLLHEQRVLMVTGRVDDRDERAKLIADQIVAYEPPKDAPRKAPRHAKPRSIEVRIPLEDGREPLGTLASRALDLLGHHQGDTPFVFRLVAGQGHVRMGFPDRKVAYTTDLERSLNDLLGPGNLIVHWS